MNRLPILQIKLMIQTDEFLKAIRHLGAPQQCVRHAAEEWRKVEELLQEYKRVQEVIKIGTSKTH